MQKSIEGFTHASLYRRGIVGPDGRDLGLDSYRRILRPDDPHAPGHCGRRFSGEMLAHAAAKFGCERGTRFQAVWHDDHGDPTTLSMTVRTGDRQATGARHVRRGFAGHPFKI